jgi:hypothetical protein
MGKKHFNTEQDAIALPVRYGWAMPYATIKIKLLGMVS